VLQCVQACKSVSQCTLLQCVAPQQMILQLICHLLCCSCVAVVLQVRRSVLQCVAVRCIVLDKSTAHLPLVVLRLCCNCVAGALQRAASCCSIRDDLTAHFAPVCVNFSLIFAT